MSEKCITFLDMTIFIDTSDILEFKKYRENEINTVMTNVEQLISSRKYQKGAIFTNLHREFDASSSKEIFMETLEELKEIYGRNSYPSALVNSKINIFLANSEKPEKTDKPHHCPRISIAPHFFFR